ncbi:MAG: universal stress protein [Rhodocyclales bacterium]|nr:universal stress protein [Rhodocyclales bacterium]
MYRSIYLPLDNSAHSLAGVDVAIELARRGGASLTGSHVYAAKLHDRRFRQMEGGLPEAYRKENKLVEQRDIHDDLITRGLHIISDSFLDVFGARCTAAGVEHRSTSLEGKNWQRLVEDIAASDCDLVVMGALGLGAVPASQLGSVCERVARRIDRDLLVMRDTEARADGAILVALDGSAQSYGALMSAFELGKTLGRAVEAVAVFDPHFHYVAFNNIAKVLSDEAASVFRFEEQEKLHEEIIDSGLARIYQGHLDVAARLAREHGVELGTRLLAGKAFEQLLLHIRESRPWLVMLGRIGVHSEAGMDLGSATENLLRLAPCNLLLSARAFEPPLDHIAETTMTWTDEAEMRMARVPDFVRGMARKAILRHAAEQGHTVITSDIIDEMMGRFMPATGAPATGGKCPFAHDRAGSGAGGVTVLRWDADALARLARIEPAALREHAKLRIEKMVRGQRADVVTLAHVEAASRAVAAMLG